VIEATAGLARVALAQGHLGLARQHADAVASFLKQDSALAENPFRTFQTYIEVYLALNEHELAREMAEIAIRELARRADRIEQLEWRKSFLENVPENYAVMQLGQRLDVQLPSVMSFGREHTSMTLVATKEDSRQASLQD
jgi:hypothetical protein